MDVSQYILETDVVAFQQAFKQRFQVELDHDTAKRELTRLVRFMELVLKPASQEGGDDEHRN